MPRRPTGQAKSFVVPLRLTGEQRDAIREAATLEHLDVSAWLRKVALDAAAAVRDRAARKAREK